MYVLLSIGSRLVCNACITFNTLNSKRIRKGRTFIIIQLKIGTKKYNTYQTVRVPYTDDWYLGNGM